MANVGQEHNERRLYRPGTARNLIRLALPAALLLLVVLRLIVPQPLLWGMAPGERIEPLVGLYLPEREPDGRTFRWMGAAGLLQPPATPPAALALDLAAPHWQPTTAVSFSFETATVAFNLTPGARRVYLITPELTNGEVLITSQASQPPGGERTLGLKLYSVTLASQGGWTALNAVLLLCGALAAGLTILRLRQPLWGLPSLVPLLLPASLLVLLVPWLTLAAGLWAAVVLAGLTRYPALLLSGLMLVAYLAANPFAITTTNDGSHYALIRALGEQGSPIIDSFVQYASRRDVALREGHYYSDRPPGMALLALPLYLVAAGGEAGSTDFPALTALLVQNTLFGVLAVALLYGVCRLTQRSPSAALFAALTFGLGTIHWKYSTILYSHALGATLSSLALWLALRARTGRLALLLGLVAGYSVAVEYTTVLLAAPLLLILFWHERSLVLWALPGLALGALPLLIYNLVAFGHPLHTGYTYHATFDWARSSGGTFVYPLWDGLRRLLFDDGEMIHGMVTLAPVLLLIVPGAILLWRSDRRLALVWALLVCPTLLLIATHRTFYGGSDRDVRYLAAILPFVAWPLAYVWDGLSRWRRPARAIARLSLCALLLLSVLNQLNHLAYTNGHAVISLEGPHTLANWRFAWNEFWWAALLGRSSALVALVVLLALAAAAGVGQLSSRHRQARPAIREQQQMSK